MKSALSSEEVEGTVRSWPPKKKGDQKTEEKETTLTRSNSAEKSDDSENVRKIIHESNCMCLPHG